MATWITLLRGVNVGGKNKLPMKALREAMEGSLGYTDVRTHIQSGNLVYESKARGAASYSKAIAALLASDFGIDTYALTLSVASFRKVLDASPFPAKAEPKSVHIAFLDAPSKVDPADLDAVTATDETWHLTKQAFYLHAPSGVARSKLVQKLDRLLGVGVTARNLNSATKILELAEGA